MTKKVAKRGWSKEKFQASVKAECKRQEVTYSATKAAKGYDDGWSVKYTVAQMSGSGKKKDAAKKAA